jgi:hypothetical protein
MTVLAGSSFYAGLRAEFLKTYEPEYKGLDYLNIAMDRDIPSDKWQERFIYWTTTPYMRQWRRGQTMTAGEFKAVNWTINNLEWALSIPFHFTSVQDDQTKSLISHARRGGQNAALLDERVFFQILNSATDASLLDAIPSAPDGVALFYATDGDGNARFGYSGGNIVTGGGVTTAALVRTDIFKAVVAAMSFQDTEGQPLHDPGVLRQGITIFAAEKNRQVMQEAVMNQIGSLSTVTAGNIPIQNQIIASGLNINLVLTQRITGNTYFVFLNGSNVKPVFSLLREPLRDVVGTFENSDNTRDTGVESIRWWMRKGYGVALPYGAVEVYNT